MAIPLKQSPSRSQRGFVLIATAISMTLLLGLAGLAIDLGRMYVIRAELQSFTDAAALTAARDLDGSAAGQDRARAGAKRLTEGAHAMRWDMGTQPITHMIVSFSTDSDGHRLVRVAATERASVIFLRIFQPGDGALVAASSVASKSGTSVRLVE